MDRLGANRWCPATLFTVVGPAVISIALSLDRSRAYHDMTCQLMRECQGSAMKVRCPSCGYIADNLPPSLRCPKCDDFSHDWLIYDWESFASMKRRHIRYNLFIIGMTLINLLVAIILKSTDAFQWLFSLLFIPAIISLFYCRKQLDSESEYEGHRGRTLLFWLFGFGGI
ncbi:membrane hypothetical protein [Pseudomonas chlororaphis]